MGYRDAEGGAEARFVGLSSGPLGNVQLQVNPLADVPDPPPGFCTVGYDAAGNGLLAFRHHDGTAVRTSAFRTDAELQALAPPLTEATPTTIATGTSSLLYPDGTGRVFRRIAVTDGLTLDDQTDPACLVLGGPSTDVDSAGTAADGASLVFGGHTLRRLAVAGGTTLDDSDPTRIVLSGPPAPTLSTTTRQTL